MKRQISYISELNVSFDTAEAAIEHDKLLPRIIETYEDDLRRMEAGLETFGGSPVTEELKEQWRNVIKFYKAKWESAKISFK